MVSLVVIYETVESWRRNVSIVKLHIDTVQLVGLILSG